jgi:hypothetical protein
MCRDIGILVLHIKDDLAEDHRFQVWKWEQNKTVDHELPLEQMAEKYMHEHPDFKLYMISKKPKYCSNCEWAYNCAHYSLTANEAASLCLTGSTKF